MVRKILLAGALMTFAATAASAHDFDTAYSTRGQCEAALAKTNAADFREYFADFKAYGEEMGIPGAGKWGMQDWFHWAFDCEKRSDGKWYQHDIYNFFTDL